MREHSISLSKFWRTRCMTLDILDYFEDGDILHLKDILEVDIPHLKKALEEERLRKIQSPLSPIMKIADARRALEGTK